MKNSIITGILAIGFTSALAIAAGTPVPFIFQGGDPASATQVNANFQELADRIADAQINGVYDFHNYLTDTSIQAKVFDTVGRCGDKETHTHTRVSVPGGTELTEKRINTDTDTPCGQSEHDYLVSASEFQFLEGRSFNPATEVLVSTATLDVPITRLTSTMKPNTAWADGSTYSYDPPAPDKPVIEKNTLAGIEDVTVPYNGGTTYTACLKIHRSTHLPVPDPEFTTGRSENILWFCPGIGLTKNMAITSNGTLVTRELSDIQR